jgi:hypothetical protein
MSQEMEKAQDKSRQLQAEVRVEGMASKHCQHVRCTKQLTTDGTLSALCICCICPRDWQDRTSSVTAAAMCDGPFCTWDGT